MIERTLSEQQEQRTELGHKDYLLRMSLVSGQKIVEPAQYERDENDYDAKFVYQPHKKRIQSNSGSRFKSQEAQGNALRHLFQTVKRVPKANPLEVKAKNDTDLAPFTNINQVVAVMRDAVDLILEKKKQNDDR